MFGRGETSVRNICATRLSVEVVKRSRLGLDTKPDISMSRHLHPLYWEIKYSVSRVRWNYLGTNRKLCPFFLAGAQQEQREPVE